MPIGVDKEVVNRKCQNKKTGVSSHHKVPVFKGVRR